MYIDYSGNYPVSILSIYSFNENFNTTSNKRKTFNLINNTNLAFYYGNVSYNMTIQYNEPKMFYSFVIDGNNYNSCGYGINLNNWYRISGYYSDNLSVGISKQLTPYLTYGIEIGLMEGISLSVGINTGNTNHSITCNIGTGAIVSYSVSTAIAIIPVPGARVVAVSVALVTTIVIVILNIIE